jgi:hypothetical protein
MRLGCGLRTVVANRLEKVVDFGGMAMQCPVSYDTWPLGCDLLI